MTQKIPSSASSSMRTSPHRSGEYENTWDVDFGSSDLTIALVDPGIDLDHPDLVANIDTSTDIVGAPGIGLDTLLE